LFLCQKVLQSNDDHINAASNIMTLFIAFILSVRKKRSDGSIAIVNYSYDI